MNPISVIIVSWNARNYLRDCLHSVCQTGGSEVREIIVVDNASVDGSPEMVAEQFPAVTLIRSSENLGFARANNLGIRVATGSFLALINSDVVVHPGCFQRLAAILETHSDVGMVGPKVIGGNGHIQLTCGRLPNLRNTACQFLALDKLLPRWPLFSGFQMRGADHHRRREVEVLSGCFWLARHSAVDEVGGLDERFFFYAEDMDWCKRFKDTGWKIMFVPDATATHFGGGSSSNAPLRYSIVFLQANLTYWKKHHGHLGWFAYRLLAIVQLSLRFGARVMARSLSLNNTDEVRHKLKEHAICLRWLMTGKNAEGRIGSRTRPGNSLGGTSPLRKDH